jgi:hypothetical protein
MCRQTGIASFASKRAGPCPAHLPERFHHEQSKMELFLAGIAGFERISGMRVIVHRGDMLAIVHSTETG